jgi:uncharacterized membrane protein
MSDNNMKNKSGRHTNWLMTAAFSTIALVAMLKTYDGKLTDQERASKWVVSSMSITLIFSAVGVFSSMLMKEKFVGTMIEGGLVCAIVFVAIVYFVAAL